MDKNLKHNSQFMTDTAVTLKPDQGHQTLCELVDSKQGYNHAKFERS